MARGEVIRVRNEFYIRSSSARVDVRTRVLKQGDMSKRLAPANSDCITRTRDFYPG
jgi:hypothetical protein